VAAEENMLTMKFKGTPRLLIYKASFRAPLKPFRNLEGTNGPPSLFV